MALAPRTLAGATVAPTAPAVVRAGKAAAFTFTLTRDGRPVTDLQPYLAAAAHVAIVSADADDFVHTHGEAGAPPASFGPQVSVAHTFARPGLYKVWEVRCNVLRGEYGQQARSGPGRILRTAQHDKDKYSLHLSC